MRASFDYIRVESFCETLDVDNIFNVCIKADCGQVDRYLCIKACCGFVNVLEFGGVNEFRGMGDSFSLCVYSVKANDKSVKRIINNFLGSETVESASVCKESEAIEALGSIDVAGTWYNRTGSYIDDEEVGDEE